MPAPSIPMHRSPIHHGSSNGAPANGSRQPLEHWADLRNAAHIAAVGILADHRERLSPVKDRILPFRGCEYRVRFTPRDKENFWQRLVREFNNLDILYPGFPGSISVTRLGLPTNPLKRLAAAVKELFTHRIADSFSSSKEAAVGLVNVFESRRDVVHGLVEADMLDVYRRFTGPVVAEDITDYEGATPKGTRQSRFTTR